MGWISSSVAGVVAATVVEAFSDICLEGQRVYFLMITLALAMVVWGLAYRWVSMSAGTWALPGFQGLFRVDFPRQDREFLLFRGPVFALSFFVMVRIARSPFASPFLE